MEKHTNEKEIRNSVNLKYEKAECCLKGRIAGEDGVICEALKKFDKNCGSYKCKFYKPVDCKDWVRLGFMLYPPESLEWKDV